MFIWEFANCESNQLPDMSAALAFASNSNGFVWALTAEMERLAKTARIIGIAFAAPPNRILLNPIVAFVGTPGDVAPYRRRNLAFWNFQF